MDLTTATLVAGFLVSTVGFSLFLYGKKQVRPPQLVGGVLMMALPFIVPGALWITVGGIALAGGTWAAARAGY